MKNKRKHPRSSAVTTQTDLTELIQYAAQLLLDGEADDVLHAQRKAAQRLRMDPPRDRVFISEQIETAILAYWAIYADERYHSRLNALRRECLNAMSLLEDFQPKALGDQVSGALTAVSGVDILLFAPHLEAVTMCLLGHDIPFDLGEWPVDVSGKKARVLRATPVIQFYAGEHRIRLIVVEETASYGQLRWPGTQRNVKGISRHELASMVQ